MTQKIATLVQILTLAAVIGLAVVVMWLSITGRDVTAERAQQDARLQFQLTVAHICANTGVLARPPAERTSDQVQEIVNDCLDQVDFPVHINVPEQ